ncbi:unnamed protein product [Sphagnum balticum]
MGPSEQPIPVAGRGAGEESGRRKPLDLWPGMYHSPVTAALWQARSNITERDGKHGPPQSKLVKRTPEQSRTRVLYSFSSDPILREQYRNPWNGCRIGKLLEDLDALAGTIAMKHCADDDHTTRPLLLVTASVDKISLKKPLHLDKDLQMKGAVAWVGRSSMEIRMEVIQPVQANTHKPLKDDIAMIANFKFVARDSETKKAALVNQLVPESEEEKQLYQEAEARDEYRKQHRKQHEDILGNRNAEYDHEKLKELLLEGRILCDMPALADHNTILIRDTKLENAIICQPQQRNMHGRIFGGFLMRRAYELAFSTCYVFGGMRPLFLEVDHVDFRKPVDVGNLLRFKACVLYTEIERADRPLIHIEVVAYVTQPEVRSSEVSNTFHFTFSLDPNFLKTSTISAVRRVLPASEEEARACLARYDADHLGKYPFLPK